MAGNDIGSARDFESVLAFGDIGEMELTGGGADFGFGAGGVVVGIVEFDAGAIDGGASFEVEDSAGDGVKFGETDLNRVAVRLFALFEGNDLRFARADAVAKVDVPAVVRLTRRIDPRGIHIGAAEREGRAKQVFAGRKSGDAEVALIVGGGSANLGENEQAFLGFELGPFSVLAFAQQRDGGLGVRPAIVKAH
jgi:hypothetical protein